MKVKVYRARCDLCGKVEQADADEAERREELHHQSGAFYPEGWTSLLFHYRQLDACTDCREWLVLLVEQRQLDHGLMANGDPIGTAPTPARPL